MSPSGPNNGLRLEKGGLGQREVEFIIRPKPRLSAREKGGWTRRGWTCRHLAQTTVFDSRKGAWARERLNLSSGPNPGFRLEKRGVGPDEVGFVAIWPKQRFSTREMGAWARERLNLSSGPNPGFRLEKGGLDQKRLDLSPSGPKIFDSRKAPWAKEKLNLSSGPNPGFRLEKVFDSRKWVWARDVQRERLN